MNGPSTNVAVTRGINTPRHPPLPSIMGARKKEIRTLTAADVGVVTACPYCRTMIQDGLDELEPGRKCRDLAEVVEAALSKDL